MGLTSQAIEILEEAINLKDDDPELYYNLSILYEGIDEVNRRRILIRLRA